jgi:hypothetical protein
MPLSRPECIPRVINFIWEANPQSLLDVGIGFGGMGVLFRQTMDVRWGRVQKDKWQTIIDGIEINKNYKNPNWEVYNNIIVNNAVYALPLIEKKYDVIFFGDILEHFEKETALELLKIAKEKANIVIVTTPINFSGNEAEAERFNNPTEEHKCLLEDIDFPEGSIIEQFGGQKFVLIK